jgi:signal transduction histidine kinase
MVSLVEGIAWALLAGAALGYAGIAFRIKRREEFPGQSSFLATCFITAVFLGAFTAGSVLSRLDTQPVLQALDLVLVFATAMTVPLVWVRFALQYTGQRFPTGRRTFVRLGIPIVLTLLVIVGTLGIGFLTFGLGLIEPSDRIFALVGAVNDYSTSLTFFYLGALLVVGASLIAWTSYSFTHLSEEGGVLIGVGFILPWFAIAMPEVTSFFPGQHLVRVYHAAVGAILGLGAVWMAVARYDLFGSVPAAGTVGRDVAVEAMNDPVLVTDGRGRLIDLNPASERAFDASVAAIGTSVGSLFDGAIGLDDLLANSTDGGEVTWEGRMFESTTSELQDEYGRLLGHSFVFHDITDRKRREQRIQVLNRVLRHNLRNDLTAVNGYAELLEEQTSNPGDAATQIQEMATELISIGEKAREIQEVVSAQQAARASTLSDVINQAVEEVRAAHGDCEITMALDAGEMEVNGTVLTSIVRELLENACRHNDADDPEVGIRTTATSGDYAVSVQVTDNGQGIPDHELTPREEGTETALEHGSGLGLWLIVWGVATVNGDIEFESTERRGTKATLWLPPAG